MKILIMSMVLSILSACNSDGYNTRRIVNDNIVLTNDIINTSLVVTKPNITVDLNNHKLTSIYDGALIEIRAKNVTIKNGTISSSYGIKNPPTGVAFVHDLTNNDLPLIINENYENTLRSRSPSQNGTVSNVAFENLETGVYVHPYVSNIKIENSKFWNNQRMGVYLDSGSRNNLLLNNNFNNNGMRWGEDKWGVDYKRRRGHLSIDASAYNTIKGNHFEDNSKRDAYPLKSNNYPVPAIELYRNCGEANFNGRVLPRLQGANNNVFEENTFKDIKLALWFRYRHHDQIGGCVGGYEDESNNNIVINSILENTNEHVRDEGANNTF